MKVEENIYFKQITFDKLCAFKTNENNNNS